MSDWHPSAQVLSDFIQGRLSDAKQSRVEVHLETCQDCSHQLRGMSLGDWAKDLADGNPKVPRSSQTEESLSVQLLRLEQETAGISALQREILLRHYLRGEPLSLISRELGLTSVDAASHLRRAIQRWQEYVAGDADS